MAHSFPLSPHRIPTMLPYNIAVVIGNPSDISRTKVLALALADALVQALPAPLQAQRQVLEIARLAPHIAAGGGALSAEGAAAVRAIESADLVIAATPVHKGAYTGLFKHLFDLVAPDALVNRPVLLAANGGSDRHALVVDHQLRPLFGFFRALTVPSAVYAANSDFDGDALRSALLQARIHEAAGQAATLLAARTPRTQTQLPTPPLRAAA
jgi:FMN reductase